jgi:tRNA pseudouridine38-40 synthase
MKYAVLIRYVGTDFFGYQVQKERRTVQGALHTSAEQLFGCPCTITGCSRTDTGVHAEEFCLTLEPTSSSAPAVPPHALPLAILPFLPHDLSVVRAAVCPEGFHPRYDAIGKEYRYRMRFGGVPDPFLSNRVWQLPYRLTERGFAMMQEAAAHFIGRHDFTSFMCVDSDIEDRVRTVSDLHVVRTGDEVSLYITGNGFLYNMVRIITGTLFEVARGRRTPESIPGVLAALDRKAAGMTAPAEGLYLHRVLYPESVKNAIFGN